MRGGVPSSFVGHTLFNVGSCTFGAIVNRVIFAERARWT